MVKSRTQMQGAGRKQADENKQFHLKTDGNNRISKTRGIKGGDVITEQKAGGWLETVQLQGKACNWNWTKELEEIAGRNYRAREQNINS